jgi:hypothetical protein
MLHPLFPCAAFPFNRSFSDSRSPDVNPPLMAGLRLRQIQNDLTFPTPVPVPRTSPMLISGINMALKTTPRALFFDVFGTCVDWRSTVVGELHAQSHASLNAATASLASTVRFKASDMTLEHWGLFAQQWRDSYKQFTKQLAADPTIPWVSVDEHHLRSLRDLMAEWQIEGLWDDEELRQISLVWHRLEPWADSAMGVALLNKLFCKPCTTIILRSTEIFRHLHSFKWQLEPSRGSAYVQQHSVHAPLLGRAVRHLQAIAQGLSWCSGKTQPTSQ